MSYGNGHLSVNNLMVSVGQEYRSLKRGNQGVSASSCVYKLVKKTFELFLSKTNDQKYEACNYK